jgi:hypothetical protein
MAEERMTDRQRLLDTAAEYVLRTRNKSYGEPDEHFQSVAKIANSLGFRFSDADGNVRELRGSDHTVYMMAVKLSRLISGDMEHEDSWIDLAGYAACGMETANLEGARAVKAERYVLVAEPKTDLESKPQDWLAPTGECGLGCSPKRHLFSGACLYRRAADFEAR